MPTKKTKKPKKETKKVKRIVKQPSKFILHISKCGTDTSSMYHNQINHDNPIILALKGVRMMGESFAPKEKIPFFEYLLACAILKGLQFDRKKVLEDVDGIAGIIKNLSLKELKGG